MCVRCCWGMEGESVGCWRGKSGWKVGVVFFLFCLISGQGNNEWEIKNRDVCCKDVECWLGN